MYTVKCPNCGSENKNTNIRCESCGTELNSIFQNEKTIPLDGAKEKLIRSIFLIFLYVPFFVMLLGGFTFIGTTIYSNVSDKHKSKNYLESEGKLVSYDNCQYNGDDVELCEGVYEYVVNGVTYKGSPNLLTDRSSFKQTIIVKYNPDNPSEYVMYSEYYGLIIAGMILIAVGLVPFISVRILSKKSSNRVNNTKKAIGL